MIQRFFFGVLLLALSGSAVLPIYSAEPPTPAVSEEKPAPAESQAKAANSYQVTPGPLDGQIAVNRHELPYPKDLQEADGLWRERLRFEYLQERLGKIDARKKSQNPKNKTGETGTSAQSNTKPKPEKEEIVATLSHRYHRILRTFTDWNNDDVLQVYLTTLAHVYDPHSDYFGHAQLESFAIGMNLR